MLCTIKFMDICKLMTAASNSIAFTRLINSMRFYKNWLNLRSFFSFQGFFQAEIFVLWKIQKLALQKLGCGVVRNRKCRFISILSYFDFYTNYILHKCIFLKNKKERQKMWQFLHATFSTCQIFFRHLTTI